MIDRYLADVAQEEGIRDVKEDGRGPDAIEDEAMWDVRGIQVLRRAGALHRMREQRTSWEGDLAVTHQWIVRGPNE